MTEGYPANRKSGRTENFQKNTLNKLGGLFICAVCFVAVTVTVFFCEPQKPVVTKVELSISTDSTGIENAASYYR